MKLEERTFGTPCIHFVYRRDYQFVVSTEDVGQRLGAGLETSSLSCALPLTIHNITGALVSSPREEKNGERGGKWPGGSQEEREREKKEKKKKKKKNKKNKK